MKKKYFFDFLWLLFLVILLSFLFNENSRNTFILITNKHPFVMGFVKFFILASMGELLALRIVSKKWKIFGINIFQKAIVWGFLGILITIAFIIFNSGVDSLLLANLLPVPSNNILSFLCIAFYKSCFLNILFGFQFMTFHRITDTLIEKGRLFKKWPFLEIWINIDWKNMWGFVGASILWFWIPAQTMTFSLPKEFRILSAALLSICLGIILSFAKLKSKVTSTS